MRAIADCELILTRGPVMRSEFSMVDAYLDAAETIAALGLRYEWLTLISGQDYPLKPLAAYEAHVSRSACQGFLQFGDVMGPDSPWANKRRHGHRRYFYRYRKWDARWWPRLKRMGIVNKLTSLVHLQTTFGPYVGVRRWDHPFKNGVRCYGGSAWHTLRRECVDSLVQLRAQNDPLVEYFRTTQSPEEAFYQTALVNGGRFKLCNDTLRLIDFANAVGGSPRTFVAADFERLAATPAFFGRKFDVTVDERILDMIDTRLLGLA